MALFGVCLFQCRYPLTQARALRWSMGLMGKRRARPFTRSARPSIHPRRPKRASFPKASLQLPSMFPLHGGDVACASCRARPPHGVGARQRTGGPRGVVGEPASLNKAQGDSTTPVYARPLPRSRPHQQSGGPEPALDGQGGRARLAARPCSRTQLNFVL